MGARPFDQLHRAACRQPVVLMAAAMEREQINRCPVGRVEAVRHVDRPHRDVTHHPDEVDVPIARHRLVGLPHVVADDVEVAVPARMRRGFDRRDETRDLGMAAHTASTVPA